MPKPRRPEPGECSRGKGIAVDVDGRRLVTSRHSRRTAHRESDTGDGDPDAENDRDGPSSHRALATSLAASRESLSSSDPPPPDLEASRRGTAIAHDREGVPTVEPPDRPREVGEAHDRLSRERPELETAGADVRREDVGVRVPRDRGVVVKLARNARESARARLL